jgi:serine/threonine-protein kinase RsbW
VFVEFETVAEAAVPELAIRVRDEGDGFDPETVANPLDPENLLKSSGRGIFLIRNFMDDVRLQRAPEGGMEIRMVKRVQPASADGTVQA